MNKLKVLFVVALSFFLFAAGYRLLAVGPANAQAPGNPVVGVTMYGGDTWLAVASNGDVYRSDNTGATIWTLRGNVFGAPTSVKPETWGGMKRRFR